MKLKDNNPGNFIIKAKGHPNIQATHKSTWEITKEKSVSKRGDCIIGVDSTYSLNELPPWLVLAIKTGKKLFFQLEDGFTIHRGTGFGHKDLLLSDPTEIVVRKSDFISARTLAINCDFAAKDIPSDMRLRLKEPNTILQITISLDE